MATRKFVITSKPGSGNATVRPVNGGSIKIVPKRTLPAPVRRKLK